MNLNIPTEDEFRGHLKEFFSKADFQVDEVTENPEEERADLLVYDQSVRVLLELKIKGEDEFEAAARGTALASGGIHRYSESSLRRNRMSALIAKGVSQLTSTPLFADFNVMGRGDMPITIK